MKTPLTLIHEATTTVAAASSALLWHLLARRFRMASPCDELLDFFEETYGVREDTAPLSWSNLEGKASESGAAAVAIDLGPSGDKLPAPLARCFRRGRFKVGSPSTGAKEMVVEMLLTGLMCAPTCAYHVTAQLHSQTAGNREGGRGVGVTRGHTAGPNRGRLLLQSSIAEANRRLARITRHRVCRFIRTAEIAALTR